MLLLEKVQNEQQRCSIGLQVAWQASIRLCLGDITTVGENIQIANLFYIWPYIKILRRDIGFFCSIALQRQ